MFTGIIECLATVKKVEKEKGNLNLSLESSITKELKIDQSLCHNGVCLTVVDIKDDVYTVTVIEESLNRSNLGKLIPGDLVNIERSMSVNSRFDGHVVQGHVDEVAICSKVQETNGSWKYVFDHNKENITVEKGSITINGVSLTVVDSSSESFSVAIIPYTYENTNFKTIKSGSFVNLEFDILGKYIAKIIHKSMYLCLVLLPVTGLLIAAMFTQGITDGPMQDSILDLHGFSADLSYILIAIHIGAALYSRIKGEGIWSSMVPLWNKEQPSTNKMITKLISLENKFFIRVENFISSQKK